MNENPYEAPASRGDRLDEYAPSLSVTRILLAIVGVGGLLLLLIIASASVCFTLNPAALQSGNQANPATFGNDDIPALVMWCVTWLILAASIILLIRCTWRRMSRS